MNQFITNLVTYIRLINEDTLTFLAYSVIFFGELKKSTRVASLNWICSYAFSMQPAISSLQKNNKLEFKLKLS